MRPTVPARSKIPVKIELYKTDISYPYEFKADVSYDLTLSGFLRWGGNAWYTHPDNRSNWNHTFVIGPYKDKASSIRYQWGKRYIPGEVVGLELDHRRVWPDGRAEQPWPRTASDPFGRDRRFLCRKSVCRRYRDWAAPDARRSCCLATKRFCRKGSSHRSGTGSGHARQRGLWQCDPDHSTDSLIHLADSSWRGLPFY